MNASTVKKSLFVAGALALVVVLVAGYKYILPQMSETPQTSDAASKNESSHGYPEALSYESFDIPVLASRGLPIILDFGAEECIPCQRMKPDLIAAWQSLEGRATVAFMDAWKNPAQASLFPIRTIPSQVIYNPDGTPFKAPGNTKFNFIEYRDKDTNQLKFTVHEGALTQADFEEIAQMVEDARKA